MEGWFATRVLLLLVLHSGSGAQARVNSPGVVDAQAFQQANVSALFETLLLLAVVHKRRLGLESAVEYAAISSAAVATSQTV